MESRLLLDAIISLMEMASSTKVYCAQRIVTLRQHHTSTRQRTRLARLGHNRCGSIL